MQYLQSTQAITSRAGCTRVRSSCWDRFTTATRTGGTRWCSTGPCTCASTGRQYKNKKNKKNIRKNNKNNQSLTCSLNSAHLPYCRPPDSRRPTRCSECEYNNWKCVYGWTFAWILNCNSRSYINSFNYKACAVNWAWRKAFKLRDMFSYKSRKYQSLILKRMMNIL